jgi:fused signal recognition particle receptor
MFGFLKDKLKKAVAKFSKTVEEEAEDIQEAPAAEEKKAPAEKKEKTPEVSSKKKKSERKKEKKEEVKEEASVQEELTSEKIEEKREEELRETKIEAEKTAELAGLRESLSSYSDEEINSLIDILKIDILKFGANVKQKSADEKICVILSKPLAEVAAAMEKIEALEDVPEVNTPVKKSEEEITVPVEAEEPVKEKKSGFFKKLFGFGKKQEKKEIAEEEPEEEKEPEETRKEEKIFEEETELPEKAEELDEELKELDSKKEVIEKEIEEDDSKLKRLEEEKKGFFGKLKEELQLKRLSEAKFEEIFFELELALLENNTAVEVIEKIRKDLREKMVDKKIKRSEIEKTVINSLKKSLDQILDTKQADILAEIEKKKKSGEPFVIVFVGINGSGKTTTIAKMAKYFMSNKLKPIMVAADTFRAAAIQQLEEHANNLNTKLIKHDYGSDPAAVAFDGIKYAKAKGYDVVLIDTAGRLHSNTNLMDEMKKIIRVSKPDMKLFIGESITGNDCIEQAQKFNDAVELDGIILSKADVDEKGGAAISVSYVTGKPILFLGTGQTYDSLEKFDKSIILRNLGLD